MDDWNIYYLKPFGWRNWIISKVSLEGPEKEEKMYNRPMGFMSDIDTPVEAK